MACCCSVTNLTCMKVGESNGDTRKSKKASATTKLEGPAAVGVVARHKAAIEELLSKLGRTVRGPCAARTPQAARGTYLHWPVTRCCSQPTRAHPLDNQASATPSPTGLASIAGTMGSKGAEWPCRRRGVRHMQSNVSSHFANPIAQAARAVLPPQQKYA